MQVEGLGGGVVVLADGVGHLTDVRALVLAPHLPQHACRPIARQHHLVRALKYTPYSTATAHRLLTEADFHLQ